MRTPAVLGASLLLVVGLAAGPAAALPAGHGDRDGWGGTGDSRTGDSWDGGAGWVDGERFSWPDDTRSWGDNVCPDMDVPKTDVRGEEQTITLEAPEGELISAYCVKAGSAKRGEGPKVVELDVPVEEITIAYPIGGKCRAISHYAVEYVDAPTPQEPTSPTEGETPPAAEETAPPEEETPPAPEETTPTTGEEAAPPAPEETTPAQESPSPAPSTLPTAPTDGSTPGMGGADYPEQGSVVEDVRSVSGGGDVGSVGPDAAAAAAPQSLPVTGAQVLGIVMAAVALLGAGVGALIWTRQRRAS
ncbi:hypothetical protein ACH436_08285 [Isoptericola sp. NPDC019693]|uniref:hypothetical protein n=1 Tax=Isoptericola sp. NPDC019693 TaxID=3364009 RepID=UPI00378EA611